MLVSIFKKLYIWYQIKQDPINYARKIGVRIGDRCRLIGTDERTFESEPYLIDIGDHVTIAGQVRFITHDGGIWVFKEKEADIELCKGIKVGNNVFIGYRSILLPGTVIGNNVVIGAGSIVKGVIPDNCVAAGVPAKPIKTLEDYWKKSSVDIFQRDWESESDKRKKLEERFLQE